MDTRVLIWIIIAIIVVALIVIGAVFFMRSRNQQREKAQHDKAVKLREDARQSELAAREGEARAAQAKADAASAAAAAQQAQARAAQSDVEAQRLADSVGEHEAEADKLRAEQEQTLRKADEVDPYVTAGGASDPVARTTTDDRAAVDDRVETADERADDVADAQSAPEQPIMRPRAARTDPTMSHDDPVIDDAPAARTDRT
ncbi:hypothetical protein [Microbacterium deminutum]|uniref:Uncharacterized protein n=1 Tax=Microbacterium deminutum TaxID=344164 RepID=A0ABP5C5P3_9MICO